MRFLLQIAVASAACALTGCTEEATGPLRIAAIDDTAGLVNPNRVAVGPGSALVLEAAAQGLVRFDAAGEIEPGLAQSWIVSDDGRRYTFRLRRTTWSTGGDVTAAQVVERLQAALSRASRNPLKPVLGAIDEIEAMTDQVLEIRLLAPRRNFLQLLAQPEMALLRNGAGTGPYRITNNAAGLLRLEPPPFDEEEEQPAEEAPPHLLVEAATTAHALAHFGSGETDLVLGGTLNDLPLLAAARINRDRVVHDPALGLFGFSFANAENVLAEPSIRQALAMAIDRDSIAAAFAAPNLRPSIALLPRGPAEFAQPNLPQWGALTLPQRREVAAAAIAELGSEQPLRLRVAMPDGHGYRVLFAHLRRDWRAIGVDPVRVPAGASADLNLIDQVAPAELSSWYLRHFTCQASAVCDAAADAALAVARTTGDPLNRQRLLAEADRILIGATVFIPILQPVRWSARSERLTGLRPNIFARHAPTELIRPRN